MLDYTKDELLSMIQSTPEKFNEWKKDREELQTSLPVAYCINLADPQMAEFGGIQISGAMGGITQIA